MAVIGGLLPHARTVDFKNTIIIMTSNIGTRQLKEFGKGIGFTAQTGENEYVSIILQEPDTRRILYYGNLVKTEGGSPDSQEGGVPLLIPANLPAGSYTLGIFAEQCNGDYATDYASDVVRIPITVSP